MSDTGGKRKGLIAVIIVLAAVIVAGGITIGLKLQSDRAKQKAQAAQAAAQKTAQQEEEHIAQITEAAQQAAAEAEAQKQAEEQAAQVAAQKEAEVAALLSLSDMPLTDVNEFVAAVNEQNTPAAPDPTSDNGHMVAIDAGHQSHGNSDREPVGPGSSETKAKVASGTHGNASGLDEYQLNLSVALKLQKELEGRGYKVYMIRTSNDVDISNAERAQMANDSGSELLVRVHANGDDNSSVNGALTMAPASDNPYLSADVIANSQHLSQVMIDSFCAATGAKNLGVQNYNNMTGINWCTIPVTIVEMGFMTNNEEDLRMASSDYQDQMAKGMADGIDAYFAG